VKALLIAAVVTVSAPPNTERTCLTQAQVEDLTMFALPPLLEAMASRCGPSLPADAYLLNGGRTLSRQLGAEGSSHWKGASSALSTFVGEKIPAGLTEETTRAFILDLASTELLGKVKPEDCVRINRLADLLSPLPPRNMAGILVTFAEMAGKDKSNGKSKALICPAPPQ